MDDIVSGRHASMHADVCVGACVCVRVWASESVVPEVDPPLMTGL